MRKLKLEVEHLAVESFLPSVRSELPRGTVHGRVDTEAFTCTGCGITETGCANNTDYCAFDSVRLCQEEIWTKAGC
jgi:hypothetical protein